eukprot:GHVS01102573.1.p1 GENE.GHVS01102573.1~~GHVS01102573.1.p1  ORF type:complete len:450 (+),score=68.56 GHVS01102573.1:403-1752(+)
MIGCIQGRQCFSSFRYFYSYVRRSAPLHPFVASPSSHTLTTSSSSSPITTSYSSFPPLLLPSSLSCFSSSSSALLTTALHHYQRTHLKARMVDFGGWSLPVSFQSASLIESHLHTRSRCSVFDVSHMGQVRLTGSDRVAFLERLVVADVKEMEVGQSKLTLFTNTSGGIMDDAIVSVQEEYLQLVLNAACRDKDVEHMRQQLNQHAQPLMDVELTVLSNMSLLALQGPKAMDVLAPLIPDVDLHRMPFMTTVVDKRLGSIEGCTVTRCGYTGEDGFEVSVPNASAVALYKLFLADSNVMPAGLGARDTLRLEAGLCLYGHDLDERISPVQAALTWTIGKRRRAAKDFLGADVIAKHIASGVDIKRVGLVCESRAVPREGSIVYVGHEVVGRVTSGTFSPSLQQPIAMGYVNTTHAKLETEVQVDVRGKQHKAKITKMPFVKAKYFKPSA